MYVVGQRVAVRRTGSYGHIVRLIGQDTLVVAIEDGPTIRFDRSQVELLKGVTNGN